MAARLTHPHLPHIPSHGRAGPAFSLLLLSAGQKLFAALVLIAALWAGVFWALA